MNKKEYMYELDYLKGISILAVLAIHVSFVQLDEFPGIDFNNIYSIFFNQLSRFCIPVFLIITALLFFRSYETENFRFSRYLSKRAKDLLVPYLLWTVASICLLTKAPWIPEYTVLKIIETVFFGSGYFFQLYYLSMLFQLILVILPIAIVLYSKPLYLTISAVIIIVINILLLGCYEFIFLKEIPMSSAVSNLYENFVQPTFPIWSGYFMIGCLIGRYYDAFKQKMKKIKLLKIILLLIFSTSYLLWDYSLSLEVFDKFMNPAENFFRISVFLYSITAFLFFFKIALINKNNKIMVTLGKYSYGIYLVHVEVLYIIAHPGKQSVMVSDWILTTVSLLLIVVLSYLIVFIINKIPYGWLIVGPIKRPSTI